MSTTRLEAFSDGVIAIIITIMVLELKVPHGTDWSALRPIVPIFLTYVMSFVFLGIYWNNHHHLMHVTDRVTGGILWANLHLLFWLSLTPVITGWMGEAGLATAPVATYGVVLLMSAIAFTILAALIKADQGPDSKLAAAFGSDVKSKVSLVLYLVAIPTAFYYQAISAALYVTVALIWFVPDRRIERLLRES